MKPTFRRVCLLLQSISFRKGSGGATAGIFAITGERSKSSD